MYVEGNGATADSGHTLDTVHCEGASRKKIFLSIVSLSFTSPLSVSPFLPYLNTKYKRCNEFPWIKIFNT